MTELHKSPHLLIVDDDEKLALLLEQFLKKERIFIDDNKIVQIKFDFNFLFCKFLISLWL